MLKLVSVSSLGSNAETSLVGVNKRFEARYAEFIKAVNYKTESGLLVPFFQQVVEPDITYVDATCRSCVQHVRTGIAQANEHDLRIDLFQ
jgi:hypothetical protein